MTGDRVDRKRQRVSRDDEDGKKARGRPRVEGADETAADVRDVYKWLLLLPNS